MHKLSHLVDGEWIAFSHPPTYRTETTSSGGRRLVAGIPGGDICIIKSLIECLSPPFYMLYVLHTPRGEAAQGRYQSPEMDRGSLLDFLTTYAEFLGGDGRFDFWCHSISENATLVWDRHNLLHAYGPLDRFVGVLSALGFSPGNPSIPSPHGHEYRMHFDAEAARLLADIDWYMSPLQPEDEQ